VSAGQAGGAHAARRPRERVRSAPHLLASATENRVSFGPVRWAAIRPARAARHNVGRLTPATIAACSAGTRSFGVRAGARAPSAITASMIVSSALQCALY